MLKYNIRTDGSSTNEEIIHDEFYVSQELGYISGVTSPNYNLIDGENVNLRVPFYDSLYKTPINIRNVKRQGYVTYNQPYEIKTLDENGEKTRYITYNDGKIYYEGIGSNNFFYIGETKYWATGDTVNVDTKYWVENGILIINNIKYEVDLNLTKIGYNKDNDYNTPLVKLEDGNVLSLKDFDYDKWHQVTKFVIHKGDDFKLFLDAVTCAQYYRYISYGNVSYEVRSDNKTTIDGVEYGIYKEDVGNDNLIDVDGELCQIKYGWKGTSSGAFLYLYLRDNITLNEGEFINATSINSTNIRLPLITDNNIGYVIFNGFKYFLQDKLKLTVVIGDVDCELFVDGSSGYYILDGKKQEVTVEGDKIKRIANIKEGDKVVRKEITNDITYYSGITIDDNIYLALKNNYVYGVGSDIKEEEVYYITINTDTKYKLIIDEITSPNIVRCHPLLDVDVLSESEQNIEAGSICSNIYNNFGDYSFTIPNKMFGNEPITPKSGMGRYNMDVNAKSDVLTIVLQDVLKIYKIIDYLTLPLNFSMNVANNLFQEMILKDEFFNVEKKNSINRIVDMEKEIYLPAYKKDDKMRQDFPLVDEIIFNLHFRTRDLESWKVIEDDGTAATSGVCNWFISDYVEYENIDEKDKFNMSDLLYFLDFTTDDVFYQKNNLSKSFLRLSFFDSKDPKTQSLLHSSSVFIDEGLLYKNYIDNIKNGEYKKIGQEDDTEVYNSIEVNTEPMKGGNIYFDEDKRLSSRFVIKNRYDNKSSSEGFYLYMFKEYSKDLHEETVYMKVDFNHAGIGRTIPLMMPLNENGEIEDNIDAFKSGYPLNKIYDQMFIELKVVYDEVNKKYVYYLPFKNDRPIMTFNLFEIKIKDESDDENN